MPSDGPSGVRRRHLLTIIGGFGGLAGCARHSNRTTPSPQNLVTDAEANLSTYAETPSETPTRTVTDGPNLDDLGSWPTFQCDLANTGHSPDVVGPKQSISSRWVVDTNPPTDRMIRSTPVIADETVFVGGGPAVYALHALDGTVQWQRKVDGVLDGAPSVADGSVFVGSRQGTLYRLSTSTGAIEWRQETGIRHREHRPSSPTVSHEMVIFGTADGVRSFDASTGEERWTALTGGETATNGRVHSTPAIGDGVVYTSHPSGMYELSLSDGSTNWRTTLPANVYVSSPALTDDRVFVGARDGSVYVLDRSSGERITRFDNEFDPDLAGSPSDEITTSPAVANGTVYAGSEDYHVYAWDIDTGKRRWRFRVGGRCYTSPAVVDGVVYVGGISGTVYGLDATTGEELWRFDTGGQILDSSPAVVNGLVSIVDHRGQIFTLQRER